MPKYDFSTKEAARLSEVPYQTVDRWIKEGVITCDIPGEGPGSRRRLNYRDVVFLIVARTLKDTNLSLKGIRKVLDTIQTGWQDDDPAHAGYVVITHFRTWLHAEWVAEKLPLKMFRPPNPSPETSESMWSGMNSEVDISYLARVALARIEAGLLEGKARPITAVRPLSERYVVGSAIVESPGRIQLIPFVPDREE